MPNVPTRGSFVIGPGCPGRNGNGFKDWTTQGNWAQAGGGYTGPSVFGDRSATPCSGQSQYVLDGPTASAELSWHLLMGTTTGNACQVWAYIPTQNAGDHHARYAFYKDDGQGNRSRLPGPSNTVDQQSTSGWTSLGTANVPSQTTLLTVTLDNQDAQSPGMYTGAADLAFACIG